MNEIKKIPNSAFDMEYSTQWRDEVDFLTGRGIYYTFRKRDEKYGITTYKYTKTADLFVALADFYLKRKRNVVSKARKPEQLSFLDEKGKLKEEMCADLPAGVAVLPDGKVVSTTSKADDTE